MSDANEVQERTVEETSPLSAEKYHQRDSKYDLTHKMAHYLDIHLLIPIMEWLESTDMYVKKDIDVAKLELLEPTKMVDYIIEVYKAVNETEEVPQEMMERRQSILDQFKVIEENEFINYLTNQSDRVNELMDSNNYTMAALKDEGLNESSIHEALQIAKFQMDCGLYNDAAHLLDDYIPLLNATIPRPLSLTEDPLTVALWGKFLADLLSMNSDNAMTDMTKLFDIIEGDTHSTPVEILEEKAYLLHWCLFLCIQNSQDFNMFYNLINYGGKDYQSVMELCCPWLFRYL